MFNFRKSSLLSIIVIVIVILITAVIAMAFTGPPAGTPPSGDPSFWIRSGSDVYYNVSGGNVGIGTTDPGATLEVKGTMKVFGAWESKSNNTVYQAETDGFVCAYNTGATGNTIYGQTDSSNPPATVRAYDRVDTVWSRLGITMPVRKGDYWRVGGASVVYWLPLGT